MGRGAEPNGNGGGRAAESAGSVRRGTALPASARPTQPGSSAASVEGQACSRVDVKQESSDRSRGTCEATGCSSQGNKTALIIGAPSNAAASFIKEKLR